MAPERPNPRDIDTRTEVLEEPTGTIEFGPPHGAPPRPKSDQAVTSPANPKAARDGNRERVRRGGPLRKWWRRFLGASD